MADAMITAPVSKTAFKMAGVTSPGQTELLAHLSRSKKFMMVFLSGKFICGLVTIHEQIKNVSKLISKSSVRNSIMILHNTLKSDLGIKRPKIAVLGLNPHAGEGGRIGSEEIDHISPAVKSFKEFNVEGPFVPDAFFANQMFNIYDAVIGMYHDQVLIPFKMMNFNSGVNFTAGLPVIRTSPDHGTAFDIAGKGIADPGSMLEAVYLSEKIIMNRRRIKSAR
jgi:4-hydroxythreonine-4-phosphate dehydrogenase